MKRLAAAVIVLGAMAEPVAAEDYPFSGAFTVAENPQAPSPHDAAHCALMFFTQARDGAFASYHVDFESFKRDGVVRYLPFNRGTCVYDAKLRLETCTETSDTDPAAVGQTYSDILLEVGENLVRTNFFRTPEDAAAYRGAGNIANFDALSYYRCPFDAEKLAGAISTTTSTLSVDARNALSAPNAKLLDDPVAQAIMKAMGLDAK